MWVRFRFNSSRTSLACYRHAVFTIWFVRDAALGGYQVGCEGLAGVAGDGRNLQQARRDAVRDIKAILEDRAEAGQPIPKLI